MSFEAAPEWAQDAVCLDVDTNLFFPESGDKDGIRLAKSICAGCAVVDLCLERNIAEPFGVVGGKSESERRTIRRKWADNGRG